MAREGVGNKRAVGGGFVQLSPRGFRRVDAAKYIGVGPTKFDEWVKDGRMPKPKRVDGCVIWDRYEIDQSFGALGTSDGVNNPWDEVED